ncbi:3'-5' exonuclease, partial [bacterium]|nr:3'-5' exonuclease [bacterium]
MRFMWLDTETTGLETTDASAFELAFILVQNGVVICERDFYLNPLSETIKYNEDAGKIHGYTEEQIKAFPPEKEQVLKIVDFLQSSVNLFKLDGSRTEKLVIAGYNVEFDKKHLKALLARNGFNYDDYFIDTADVFEQVKRASIQKALPYLP